MVQFRMKTNLHHISLLSVWFKEIRKNERHFVYCDSFSLGYYMTFIEYLKKLELALVALQKKILIMQNHQRY